MIRVYSKREIDCIRESCQLTARALNYVGSLITPGVTTKYLDAELEKFIRDHGAIPAFKGIVGDAPKPFPASGCFSIDEVVVHGIPTKKELQDGEIIGIDTGVLLNGFYGDAARTYPVGEISFDKQRLLQTAEDAFWKGIEFARSGAKLSAVSHHIQKMVEGRGYSVVRALVGHGIGRNLHEDPQVPNFGSPGLGPKLKPGMVLAVEPMINVGTYEVLVLDDGWTIVTADRKPSAHYENTIAISENGAPEILTIVEEN